MDVNISNHLFETWKNIRIDCGRYDDFYNYINEQIYHVSFVKTCESPHRRRSLQRCFSIHFVLYLRSITYHPAKMSMNQYSSWSQFTNLCPPRSFGTVHAIAPVSTVKTLMYTIFFGVSTLSSLIICVEYLHTKDLQCGFRSPLIQLALNKRGYTIRKEMMHRS